MTDSRLRSILGKFGKVVPVRTPFSAEQYWESRYASGGNSGEGSYGKLAAFKAETINALLSELDITSVVEFGCGDGNQLASIRYPRYTGLDVSPSAIAMCMRRFEGDRTKSFFLYDPQAFRDSFDAFRADASVSLDVIYHLVSDDVFARYMDHLCDAAGRFLIVYSTDVEKLDSAHVRHREFSRWISSNRPEFRLMRQIANPYPGTGAGQSDAAFKIYAREASR